MVVFDSKVIVRPGRAGKVPAVYRPEGQAAAAGAAHQLRPSGVDLVRRSGLDHERAEHGLEGVRAHPAARLPGQRPRRTRLRRLRQPGRQPDTSWPSRRRLGDASHAQQHMGLQALRPQLEIGRVPNPLAGAVRLERRQLSAQRRPHSGRRDPGPQRRAARSGRPVDEGKRGKRLRHPTESVPVRLPVGPGSHAKRDESICISSNGPDASSPSLACAQR